MDKMQAEDAKAKAKKICDSILAEEAGSHAKPEAKKLRDSILAEEAAEKKVEAAEETIDELKRSSEASSSSRDKLRQIRISLSVNMDKEIDTIRKKLIEIHPMGSDGERAYLVAHALKSHATLVNGVIADTFSVVIDQADREATYLEQKLKWFQIDARFPDNPAADLSAREMYDDRGVLGAGQDERRAKEHISRADRVKDGNAYAAWLIKMFPHL